MRGILKKIIMMVGSSHPNRIQRMCLQIRSNNNKHTFAVIFNPYRDNVNEVQSDGSLKIIRHSPMSVIRQPYFQQVRLNNINSIKLLASQKNIEQAPLYDMHSTKFKSSTYMEFIQVIIKRGV